MVHFSSLIKKNWLIIIVLVLAVGLRLPLLSGSFWLDEAAQALESARPLYQQLDIIDDFQPPLIHLVTHFSLYFSASEWWLRAVAALIPGLVTIVGAYAIGVKVGGKQVGIWTALLLATSSFHIFYSQELRPYSLPAMFAVLSWWLLLLTSDKQTQARKTWVWVGFCLTSILGLYSSFLYPFLALSQVVWLVGWQRAQLKLGLVALVIAALAFTPWLPRFSQQLAAGGEVRVQLPGWSEVVSIPQLKALPLVAGKFIFGVVDLSSHPLFVSATVLLGIIALFLMYRWWRGTAKQPQKRRYVWMTLVWLLVPLISAWIVSFWIPVVQPKRVLYLMPALYLFLSLIAQQAKRKYLGYVALGLVLLINLISVWTYYTNPRLQRENWRALHQEILSSYPADRSIAVFVFPEPFAPWVWYDQGEYPTFSTGTLHIDQTENLRDQLEKLIGYQYVLVFDYLRDLTDPNDQILKEVEAFGFRPVELIDYPNIGYVRVYARPEAVMSWRVTGNE